jgi:hypothetical protein
MRKQLLKNFVYYFAIGRDGLEKGLPQRSF